MCLDTGKDELLKQAIGVSRLFRLSQQDPDRLPEVIHLAKELLVSLENYTPPPPPARVLVVADSMNKTYSGSMFSLRSVSLQVRSGDILGVVGENGHGKTTLLRCLAGQLALDSGELHFPQLGNADHYAIKHEIAFIPQRIPRWYGQLKDNLHFSAAIAGITGGRNRLMVDFMLERLNLTPYAELNWNQISSGYRTRFEIARILLQRPSLLILDEPLANLDINAQQTILTDLRYMAKSIYQPMGIILSSQQLHEVEKVADTVMFIRNGNCLFSTADETGKGPRVVELETQASREQLIEVLRDNSAVVSYNGGFYTITSENLAVGEILARLVQENVPVSYFRDITHSTKRFF